MSSGHEGSRSGAVMNQLEEEARLQSNRYQISLPTTQRPQEPATPTMVVRAIPLKEVIDQTGSATHRVAPIVVPSQSDSRALQPVSVMATAATTPGVSAAAATLSPQSAASGPHASMHLQAQAQAQALSTQPPAPTTAASASATVETAAQRDPTFAPMMNLSRELLVKLWPKERALAGRLVCKTIGAELSTMSQVMLSVSEKSIKHPSYNLQGVCDMVMKYNLCGVDVRDETLCANTTEKCCKHIKCNVKETGIILAEGLMEAFRQGFTSLVGLKIGIACKDLRKGLIRSLKSQNDLGTLSLRGMDDGDVRSLAKILFKCEKLETLDLSRNDFGVEGSRAMSSIIESSAGRLTSLDVSCNRFGVDGCEALAQNLGHCSSLRSLSLARNVLQNEGMRHLASKLGQLPSLSSLDLSANDIGVEGAISFANQLSECKRLQHINFAENGIKDEGAGRLGDNLIHCRHLTHLVLSACSIRGEGMKLLARTLRQCQQLEHIDLARNDLRAEGAKELAEVLLACPELTFLNVSENRLGAKGAKQVADAILGCHGMKHLDLGANRIRDDGADKLADTFKELPNLETIKLSLNCFSHNGAKALSEAFHTCRKLKNIDLSSNGLTAPGVVLLLQALHDRTVGCIDLSQNRVTLSDPEIKGFLAHQMDRQLLKCVKGLSS